MARGGGMQQVELDDGPADLDAEAPAPSLPFVVRRRWWLVGAAGVVVLGVLGAQLVADARERAAVARLADVPGVLAPIDEALPVRWRSDSFGDVRGNVVVDGALVGASLDETGAQLLVAQDLTTGAVRWSVELYGPDPARAEAMAESGASAPPCVPTTDDPEPAQLACLVSDGFLTYGNDVEQVPATTSFVRVVDTADGRTVAQWDAPEGSLAVLDGLAVLASYADDAGAITLDGRDLLTGVSRWSVQLPAPKVQLDPESFRFPPYIVRVGDYVEHFGTDGTLALYDAAGARVHAELGADPANRDGGQVIRVPGSERLVYSAFGNNPGRASTTVLGGDRPAFDYTGDPLIPTVDDGSVPGLLLFAARDGSDGSLGLHGLDAETGELRWKTHVPVTSGLPPLVIRGRVVVATVDGLAAVDGRTGKRLWSVDAPTGEQFGVAMTDPHHLVIAVHTVQDYRDTALVALDPTTGAEVWRTSLPERSDQLYPIGDALVGVTFSTDGTGEVLRVG